MLRPDTDFDSVSDLTTESASLEQIFLAYYGAGSGRQMAGSRELQAEEVS